MHYWTRSSFQLTANHHQFVWWDLLLIRKGMNWAKPIKIRHCFVTKRKLQHFCRENVDSTLWAKKMAYLRFELTPHFIPLRLTQTDSDHATRVAPNHSGNMISATHTMSCANHMSHSWLPNSTDLHFGSLFAELTVFALVCWQMTICISTHKYKRQDQLSPKDLAHSLSVIHFHLIKSYGQITFTFT